MEIEIKKLVEILNMNYPTSYEERFEHHIEYITKRAKALSKEQINNYVLGNLVKDNVIVEFCKMPKAINANARKTENIIQINYTLLNDDETYLSGYKKEHKYMMKYVNNYKDYVKWVVCHEYCHLLHPKLGHTNQFFNEIEKLYINTSITN